MVSGSRIGDIVEPECGGEVVTEGCGSTLDSLEGAGRVSRRSVRGGGWDGFGRRNGFER